VFTYLLVNFINKDLSLRQINTLIILKQALTVPQEHIVNKYNILIY